MSESQTGTGHGGKGRNALRQTRSKKGTRGRQGTKGSRTPNMLINKVDKSASNALKELEKKDKKEYKLLLLGAGESGKTTIHKQIQLIHGEGFAEEDREDFRSKIWHNLIDGMECLVNAHAKGGVSFKDKSCQEAASMVSEVQKNRSLLGKEPFFY